MNFSDKTQTITLEVEVPQQYAATFLRHMTGSDTDIILAAEKAMRNKIVESYVGEDVQVSIVDEDAARAGLEALAAIEESETRRWGRRRDR